MPPPCKYRWIVLDTWSVTKRANLPKQTKFRLRAGGGIAYDFPMKTALRAAVPPNVKAKEAPAARGLDWHVYGSKSDDEREITLRLASKIELGTFDAATWRKDAAREMVEFMGAAMHDDIVAHIAGKVTRIQIAKELGVADVEE
jgi:hypothetical protein